MYLSAEIESAERLFGFPMHLPGPFTGKRKNTKRTHESSEEPMTYHFWMVLKTAVSSHFASDYHGRTRNLGAKWMQHLAFEPKLRHGWWVRVAEST